MTFTIRLNKQNKTIKVVNRRESIRLTHTKGENVRLQHTGKPGPRGEQGIQGEPGVGVPAGGLEDQLLAKASDEDYDYEWTTPVFSGDKTAASDFIATDVVEFSHYLNKYPSVSVIDSAGDEVEGDVEYINTNSVVVRFVAPFSGKITCN